MNNNVIIALGLLFGSTSVLAAGQHDGMAHNHGDQASSFSQLSPRQALEQSHQWHRSGEASVKIMPDVITAEFADGSKTEIPVKEEFLLSIAPYVEVTHPCTYHVPTGCQGELTNQNMMVEIKDTQTNQILQSGMVKTQKDGFIDFWMPKNGRYEFTFSYQGKTATEVLTTDSSSRTCITSMQLL